MHAEDRLIHFSIELIHAPVQHKVPALQKLYYTLSQTRAAYDSTDFTIPQQFKFYSRRSNAQSVLVFVPDRVAMVEEWADIALSDFCEKVREVGLRVLDGLEIPVFIAETVTLRSTFSLTHFDDARVFLLDNVCCQADRIGPHFRRPISIGGLRFVLPETDQHRGTLHILIESFRHNNKEVFVELKSVFGEQKINVESIATAIANIQKTRAFIINNIFPYLDQFDTPQEK